MKRRAAKFISFEGIEGVGKSTALQSVRDYLEENAISYMMTREPGGTPIAEAIRQVLLNHYPEKMNSETELLLMFAGRAQNIHSVILPALERGQWVLSDRFSDSSFAYQGGGRGVPIKHIAELASWVQGDLTPDLTILLDAPAAVGLSRVDSRSAKDRIEIEGVEFFERVRQQYLDRAAKEPERFCVIDSNQNLALVTKQVLKAVAALQQDA